MTALGVWFIVWFVADIADHMHRIERMLAKDRETRL